MLGHALVCKHCLAPPPHAGDVFLWLRLVAESTSSPIERCSTGPWRELGRLGLRIAAQWFTFVRIIS